MPIRMASTLLRRKRNFTAKSLVKRLHDENKRIEFIEPVLAASIELASDGTGRPLVSRYFIHIADVDSF